MAALSAAIALTAWLRSGSLKATFRGHKTPVYAIAFAPDGKLLASGGADRTVRIWDLGTRTRRATLAGHAGFVLWVAFSPDGKTLASWDGREVRLWDVATGRALERPAQDPFPWWANQGRPVGSGNPLRVEVEQGSEPRTLTLRDAATDRKIATLAGHPDRLNDWAIQPGGTLIATGGGSTDHPWPINRAGDVRVWDTRTGRLLATFRGHWGAISDVEFAPDGRTLASASYDGTIKLWDVSRFSGP